MPRWSELLSVDPLRLEIELAKAGTDPTSLVSDAHEVPELVPILEGLSKEAALQVALEYFGDEGNPQPTERTDDGWIGRTPDFGQLHRLEDDGQTPVERSRRKKPRHRPPTPIARETVKDLMLELAQRKTKPPRDHEYAQEQIAGRLKLKTSRVQQAEGCTVSAGIY